jgi:hypothetical protein
LFPARCNKRLSRTARRHRLRYAHGDVATVADVEQSNVMIHVIDGLMAAKLTNLSERLII